MVAIHIIDNYGINIKVLLLETVPRLGEQLLFETEEGILGYRVEDVKYFIDKHNMKYLIVHVNTRHLFGKDFTPNLLGVDMARQLEEDR